MHRKVAASIEALDATRIEDHLSALAYHWSRAAAPAAETHRAVDYTTRAGDRALAQLAHDEAASYYRSALDLLDLADVTATDRRRLPLLISLGEAQRRSGDPGHRQTLLDACTLARSLGDAEALTRAALANSAGVKPGTFPTVDHERVAALEAALGLVGTADSPARARLLAACHTFYLSRELARPLAAVGVLEAADAIWWGWPQFEQFLALAQLDAGNETEARARWRQLVERHGAAPRNNCGSRTCAWLPNWAAGRL